MNLLRGWAELTPSQKLTALVAFGRLFHAGAAAFQVYLMESSARETSRQVNKVIREARRIADTTEKTFAQSKRVLDSNIEMNRNDHRAWVGPIDRTSPAFSDGSRSVYIKEGFKTVIGVLPFMSETGGNPILRSIRTIRPGEHCYTTKNQIVFLGGPCPALWRGMERGILRIRQAIKRFCGEGYRYTGS